MEVMRKTNQFESSLDRMSDYSDEAIFSELRRLSQQLGKTDVSIEDIDRYGRCSYALVKKRFGGMRAALQAAGVEATTIRKGISKEHLLRDLATVWEKCLAANGRRPFKSELRQFGSEFSGTTYEKHFGTWIKACESLLEWEGQDERPLVSRSSPQAPSRASPQLKKSIPLRIRYVILVRDRFTCRLCGKSPTTHPGTALHIDHIVPESLGGTLDESNLRCLCGECNIGKGATPSSFEGAG